MFSNTCCFVGFGGLTPQQQPGSYRGGNNNDDDDEVSVLPVEQTGGNHLKYGLYSISLVGRGGGGPHAPPGYIYRNIVPWGP